MANKKAAWQDERIVAAVSGWWHKKFPFNEANVQTISSYGDKIGVPGVVTLDDLYDSYYGYCADWHRRFFRINREQFAKCLMAARILDIGGVWRQSLDWDPTPGQIRRVTGDE